ncbi:MAG: hypothetical protein JWP69_2181 [Flaviaesturariibacter sp.]|nr:hypothetical protein [Flaviaesturariibacter sp.]
MSTNGKGQFLDQIEPSYLETLEDTLSKKETNFYKDWELVEHKNIDAFFQKHGSFLSKRPENPSSNLKRENLESQMHELIKPWDSGKGIMMGYDSTEELDWHFMSIAANAIKEFILDAGLHPGHNIKGVKTSDILAVITCLISFNLKHIEFSSIASKKIKEISTFQSLTIWCSLSKLISDISSFTSIDENAVASVFKLISLKSEDAVLFRMHTSKFMPLIIDLENDFVLRPVSSILRNPLNSIKDLLTLRNPNQIADFLVGREAWLRKYLYAMFMGTRYYRVEGNIALRINKKFITDIDAAIYDNVTGELALFQIKWQDYNTNDVRVLRSKASNLTDELDTWTRKVSEWISSQGVNQLEQNLRLPNKRKVRESKIYLFGLSKNAARMKGYGFELKEKKIAVGTWVQFVRNRTEIGPSNSVFGDIHKALKQQEDVEINVNPRPVTFKLSDKEFHYKDLWNVFEA